MSKKQWKNIDVSLKFSTTSDWALEEPDAPLSDVNTIRSSLPTKTNATRQTAELDNISENGPFILNFGNISFEATEDELRHFFRSFTIIGMELNNPRRGCGHIEFTNINDLAGAWKMNEKMFLNRPIRLSIPLKDDMARQQTIGNKQRYQPQTKSQTFESDESDNWRVKRPQVMLEKESAVSSKEGGNQWRTKTTKEGDSTVKPCPSDASDWRTDSSIRRNKTMHETEKKTDIGIERNAWKTSINKDVGKKSNQADVKSHENVDDKTNWRGRGTLSNAVQGDTSNESENWRKPRSTDILQPSTKVEEQRDSFSGPVNIELSGNKKKDIFGEAKPIDTSLKDLEIEKKLEQVKLTVTELSKQELTMKPISRTSTKTTNVSEIDASDNWRVKPTVTQPILRLNPDNIKEPVNIHDSSPKKLQPAPPPAVNIWDLRKKSKIAAFNSTAENQTTNVVDEKVAETKSKENVMEMKLNEKFDTEVNETKVINTADQSHTIAVIRDDVDNKVAVKNPTVISINGPYIDPRSHRTPQQSVSETKAPTAVPIPKGVSPSTKADDPCPQSTTKISNKTFASMAASSSSWSNGPPKSLLIDKQAITSHPGN